MKKTFVLITLVCLSAPVWAESKENAGGPIVTEVDATFMTPTDYSPLR